MRLKTAKKSKKLMAKTEVNRQQEEARLFAKMDKILEKMEDACDSFEKHLDNIDEELDKAVAEAVRDIMDGLGGGLGDDGEPEPAYVPDASESASV